MSELDKLIEAINEKYRYSGKVYRDEPIITTASKMKSFTPQKYREMRQIAKKSGFYLESDAVIFCSQGKFMEDYEDDYEYRGEFARYFPTYQSMNDQQLRGYFSWRTKVRKGIVEKTSLSFVFVYIYEILNQIGVASPQEGYEVLVRFWSDYKELDDKIDYYMKMWLRDYVVYYNLDKSCLKNIDDAVFDGKVLTLLHCKDYSPDEIFEVLNNLSSYNFTNSGFYKKYSEEVKQVVYLTFVRLTEYYDKHRKNSLCENYFGKIYTSDYSMFRSAVFYDKNRRQDFTYEINEVNRFRCINGRWSSERFYYYSQKNRKIGELLKTVDFLMRKEFNFNRSLKMDEIKKIHYTTILDAIQEYRVQQKKAAVREIEIDVTKLDNIRSTSVITQNKLITEEDMIEEPVKEAPVVEASEPETAVVKAPESGTSGLTESGQQNFCNLSDTEAEFLKCLLEGQPYGTLLKSKGMMASVIADSINEKLYDEFYDTVLEMNGEEPEIIEDYLEDLKGLI